jgi:uncharacterized protein with ParB-like and HNH nuclease domain
MTRMLPTQKYVSELVEEFMDGSLAIPEIQRDVVWKPDQVKELIASLFRSYPCGSLIFWERYTVCWTCSRLSLRSFASPPYRPM